MSRDRRDDARAEADALGVHRAEGQCHVDIAADGLRIRDAEDLVAQILDESRPADHVLRRRRGHVVDPEPNPHERLLSYPAPTTRLPVSAPRISTPLEPDLLGVRQTIAF